MSDEWDNAKPAKPGKNIDRLPPHSVEAEQGVLGCLLLAPEDGFSECGERNLTGEWFYDLRHRTIWEVLHEMHEAVPPVAIDVITVQQTLRQRNELESIGGLAYLATLPDAVPSAANLAYYLEILWEQWLLRRTVALGTEMVARCYARTGEKGAPPIDVSALMDQIGRDALALGETVGGHADVGVKELVLQNVEQLEGYHRGTAQLTGLTTGLAYVDKVTGGLGGENGNFIVVAARPGMGKTSIGLDFLLHVALDAEWFTPLSLAEAERRGVDGQKIRLSKDGTTAFERQRGRPAAFFTLEMSPMRLVRRMLFQRSGADLHRFRTGFANGEDFARLSKASAEIALGPIRIDGTKRLTIDLLKARCRRLARQHGIKMFVLDYLQLMKTDRRRYRTPDRVAEMEEISGEIAALSCELDVPFFILAQLNRELEKAERKRAPQLSDIKNCGAIEQDADVVMMLWEPKLSETKQEQWDAAREQAFGKGEDWSQIVRRVNLLVEKNRDGATGDCELLFHKKNTHFQDYNEWLKRHGLKALAKGERGDKDEGGML